MRFPCFGGVLRQRLLCDANVTSTSLVDSDEDEGDCDEADDHVDNKVGHVDIMLTTRMVMMMIIIMMIMIRVLRQGLLCDANVTSTLAW